MDNGKLMTRPPALHVWEFDEKHNSNKHWPNMLG